MLSDDKLRRGSHTPAQGYSKEEWHHPFSSMKENRNKKLTVNDLLSLGCTVEGKKKKKKGRGNNMLYYSHFVNEVNMGVFEFKISQ